MNLLENERLDYIPGTPYSIIQSREVFSFSMDAVLLGRFVRVPIQKGRIIDLCSGNGIIGLVLSERSKADITSVELQERLHDMATRSVLYNSKQKQILSLQADVNNLPPSIEAGSYDVVTCNPPYFKANEQSDQNHNPHYTIARHEVHCTLQDIIRTASILVKQKGKVALVHRPERLTDMIDLMRQYRIEPKRLQLIQPNQHKDANMVLLEGIKDGKSGLTCLPSLCVYGQDGVYTDAFREVYEQK
ncbi:tRNA1(Val) (adenine(37)-N6)-methyltransferase [Alkalicoccobacillus plakortidis]|uniref:tRNA1(Val) (Adenine(37)-N6)-methyltransferase n=1 Tax=Alkalicoccobacillus plakortidis TaxID=444060 RepID=A0ABT0XKY1_9BACI|nr:tRNA1(Val) (adenine(37)-N6)-methyltransferase [Alkalicoccobacillus plakortidis]MCM2676492.1 tRNA1(Val) (adenine(37)-N6)-methyltransferase [Alkalicoccobacillus plakortidis]